jgi:hypothetical protein
VDWPAAETFFAFLDTEARRTLLGILEGSSELRAEAIRRIYARHEEAPLSELLIELERSEWARQWFIERLSWPLEP